MCDRGRIFLSYAREDVGKINVIFQHLKRAGFSPWQDHKFLLGDQDWFAESRKAANQSQFILICLSKHSFQPAKKSLSRETLEQLEVIDGRDEDSAGIILIRLDEHPIPANLEAYPQIDIFSADDIERLIISLREQLNRSGDGSILKLRSEPIQKLSLLQIKNLIHERNFFAANYWLGDGIYHQYESAVYRAETVIVDHTTGLMWQQSGSEAVLNYDRALYFIAETNRKNYAGFNDWRLPTVEEALSLLEPQQNANGLYIDSRFSPTQYAIWTADKFSRTRAWLVFFNNGYCNHGNVSLIDFARLVRSHS